MKNLNERIINFIKWIKEQCKDWKTFVILLIVIMIVYFPTWGGYLLYAIFRWNWCLTMATASMVFWAGPFTPFFPLCIAITLFIKKLIEKINEKSIK